ncbi:hypothetical protein M513_11335 [Trichuris suis]|uniref:Reverse transcriptase domain-containing protein n=1 Tax=Trichuris suis TaxID=68888 RepID=A0A085LS39_9BILA|nr:hypothetical protein M513_11335 [Trichuris suis]
MDSCRQGPIRLEAQFRETICIPKIHTPDVPLRPIVSSTQSITYQLSTYLKSIIQSLVGNRESTVKNCKLFVEQIRLSTPSPSDILVSYDVKDLFTSIPIPYTLNMLHQLLYTDRSLPNRTKLSPSQIVQLGRFYRQEGGALMGSPSPVLAEVFMEHLEEKAFSDADHNILPHLFKRYVDDIFVIIESGRQDTFLNFLNGLFPSIISFTIEKETSATYIGETGFSLAHRFSQHMRHLERYTRAKQDLENGGSVTTRSLGRTSSVPPTVAMERTLAASAVAEHAAHCSGSLQKRVICKESHLSLLNYLPYQLLFTDPPHLWKE